jgi:hypothetical protein
VGASKAKPASPQLKAYGHKTWKNDNSITLTQTALPIKSGVFARFVFLGRPKSGHGATGGDFQGP